MCTSTHWLGIKTSPGSSSPGSGVMAVCAAWMYVAEHGFNKAMDSPFDAPWWGVVPLTRVGYGHVYPVTIEGRITAMALMLLGIELFGAITATITSYLITRDIQQLEDQEAAAGLRNPGTRPNSIRRQTVRDCVLLDSEAAFIDHTVNMVLTCLPPGYTQDEAQPEGGPRGRSLGHELRIGTGV